MKAYVEFVQRKVLNVFEDDNLIIDLSWIDDEISMVAIPQYESHVIIDKPIKIARPYNPDWNFSDVKEIEKNTRRRGRQLLPKTGYMPAAAFKQGRPNIAQVRHKNILFGKDQGIKPILSHEDGKHYRLVILQTIRSNDLTIKYTINEVSTFYLAKKELDMMKQLSWCVINYSEIGYFNPELKLTPEYTLPPDFLPIDYFSDENIYARYKILKKKEIKIDQLQKSLVTVETYFNDFMKKIYGNSQEPDINLESFQKFMAKYFSNSKEAIDLSKATTEVGLQFYDDLDNLAEDIKKSQSGDKKIVKGIKNTPQKKRKYKLKPNKIKENLMVKQIESLDEDMSNSSELFKEACTKSNISTNTDMNKKELNAYDEARNFFQKFEKKENKFGKFGKK